MQDTLTVKNIKSTKNRAKGFMKIQQSRLEKKINDDSAYQVAKASHSRNTQDNSTVRDAKRYKNMLN